MQLSTLIAELAEVYKRFGDKPVMVRVDHETRPLASDSIAFNLANGHVSIAAYSHEGMARGKADPITERGLCDDPSQ